MATSSAGRVLSHVQTGSSKNLALSRIPTTVSSSTTPSPGCGGSWGIALKAPGPRGARCPSAKSRRWLVLSRPLIPRSRRLALHASDECFVLGLVFNPVGCLRGLVALSGLLLRLVLVRACSLAGLDPRCLGSVLVDWCLG